MKKKISWLVPALIALLPPFGSVAGEDLKGIELSDIDRNAEACTDFFEFANGAWRAANPIPPSMVRWSRRWEAGEASKDRLKGSSTRSRRRPTGRRAAPTS